MVLVCLICCVRVILFGSPGHGGCCTAGYVDVAAFWAYRGFEHHRLAYDLPPLLFCFCLLAADMLVLVGAHGVSRLLWADIGGALVGHTGIIGLVLVLAFFAGLAFPFPGRRGRVRPFASARIIFPAGFCPLGYRILGHILSKSQLRRRTHRTGRHGCTRWGHRAGGGA